MEHKILLVDDDRDLLEMLCSIFRRAGYTELVTASSGQEALQVWREQQPALIVLDVMMPGMDGFEVLREIRRTSHVPILMLTARGEAEDRIEGLEIGADDYLPKPFLPKELLLRVQAILHRSYPEPHRTVELAASTVDLEKAEVLKNGERLPLTAKELQLFQKLYETRNFMRMPGGSSPPASCARPSAGSSGRATRAPSPPISATCGRRSRTIPPSRFPW